MLDLLVPSNALFVVLAQLLVALLVLRAKKKRRSPIRILEALPLAMMVNHHKRW